MNGWTVETGVMHMNNITPSPKKKTSISVREKRPVPSGRKPQCPFYSGHKTEDELDGLHARSIEQAAAPQPAEPETDQQLLLKLLNNPGMAALLKTLAKSL